ncbi:histidine kinase N-terminal domain-containing protein [Hungatella sp.]|uniref:histidine kinase N-terminal domain-containing protein n=1 Tax=Hungatella sp. TaxID=2613924 RepID=UPI00399540FB
MTTEEIRKRTGLSEKDAETLKQTEQMPLMMAELAGADLFIDCMNRETGTMFVAAQAGPKYMPSAYQNSVVGCIAEKEDEPAVYRALETRAPVRDIKAVTQEDKTVRRGRGSDPGRGWKDHRDP